MTIDSPPDTHEASEAKPVRRPRRWRRVAGLLTLFALTGGWLALWAAQNGEHRRVLKESRRVQLIEVPSVPLFVYRRLPPELIEYGKKIVEIYINGRLTPTEWDAVEHVAPKRVSIRHISSNASAVKRLFGITSLEAIRINGGSLTRDSLGQLARMPRLRYLSLNVVQLPEGGADLLAESTSLERLRLLWIDLDDAAFRALSTLPTLRAVAIADKDLKQNRVEALARCSSLERLDLIGTKLEGKDLAPLEQLSRLRVLLINRVSIGVAGAEVFLNIPQLEVLLMPECTSIDEAAALLGRHPGLQQIDLSGTNLTESGLAPLMNAPELRETGLSNTDVSESAQAAIFKRHPHVRWKGSITVPFRHRLD